MNSYFMDKNKRFEVFVAQEVGGVARIVKKDRCKKTVKGLCRRRFQTIKEAQERLDEIAQSLGWQIAHYINE